MKFLLPLLLLVSFTVEAQNRRHQPDFNFLASLGSIKGIERFLTFGASFDVDTADVPTDVASLGTPFIPSEAQIVAFVSTSAQDGPTGTGIRELLIEGLDAGYTRLSETIVLDGINTVSSTGEYIAVNRLTGVLSGTTGESVGVISADHGSNNLSEIPISEGVSHQVMYTVPLNHVLMLDNITASQNRKGTGTSVLEFLVRFPDTNTWVDKFHIGLGATGNSFLQVLEGHQGYLKVPEKSVIRVVITNVDTNDNEITASMNGYLVNLALFKR